MEVSPSSVCPFAAGLLDSEIFENSESSSSFSFSFCSLTVRSGKVGKEGGGCCRFSWSRLVREWDGEEEMGMSSETRVEVGERGVEEVKRGAEGVGRVLEERLRVTGGWSSVGGRAWLSLLTFTAPVLYISFIVKERTRGRRDDSSRWMK